MIQCEFQVCIIDDLPVDQSPVYDVILRELGEELANKWTKIVLIPPDDDE